MKTNHLLSDNKGQSFGAAKTMQEKKRSSYLFGSNVDFIEELYDKYLTAPQELNPTWKKIF